MTNTDPQPIVGGHVMCDDCNQPHPAEYSHMGRFGEGPVYIVMCGELADYYLTERVIRTTAKPIPKTRTKHTAQCANCGEWLERTTHPKRDWYHVGGTSVCHESATATSLGLSSR